MTEQAPVYTVSQITQAVKLCLESAFPLVRVQGEVSNFKRQSSGHLYFSVKDDKAQLSCVMFRGDASRIKTQPKDGDNVILKGELNVYPPSGRYQLVVRELKQEGLGELLLKLEELKKEIHKRGWFKKEHKKPLPPFPKRIGVVTSPTGAAIRDIIHVLSRRLTGIHLVLNPVKVQGEGAAEEIARAIRQFNRHRLADVLIVGRGGGSIEDLWAFNEEVVAEAVFKSEIPIIGAVGHETDHCIAEYVADARAPTPSAAAEMATAETAHYLKQLKQLTRQIERRARQQLNETLQLADSLKEEIDGAILRNFEKKRLLLASMQKQHQALNPTLRISHFKQRLGNLLRALDRTAALSLAGRKEKFNSLVKTLAAIDPKNLLKRGYSITFCEKSGAIIKSVGRVKKEERIKVMLSDGSIAASVKEVL